MSPQTPFFRSSSIYTNRASERTLMSSMTPVLSHLEYIYLMVSFEDLRLIRLAFVIQLCFYLFYVSLIITERELCAILFEFIAMLASSFNVREQFP